MRDRQRIHGVYGITDARLMPSPTFLAQAEAALAAGLPILQYRDKQGDPQVRRRQAAELRALCAHYDALFVVNDDPLLARDVAAPAIHVGAEDPDLATVRALLGSQVLIGVSCYGDVARAQRMALQGADYVAFGAFYPSASKPEAVLASRSVLPEARAALALPVVAIGGIDADNASDLVAAGAHALAVISALFGSEDVAAAYHALARAFASPVPQMTQERS